MNIFTAEIARVDAIYARQSIDKADSISIENQIEFCKYETRGRPYIVFYDKGYSGKNMDRPQFQELLQQIRLGYIERVICYKLDRCSRSILDFTQLVEEFHAYHVEFVSCTEKFDTSTPMGRAMLNICIVFAQLERETIQQRVYDTYHARNKQGFYMGGRIPYGFRLEPYLLHGKKTAHYVPYPPESQTLLHMYTVYAKTSTSLADIVSSLEDNNMPNQRREDGKWIRSHISRMLSNPIYVRADHEIYRYYRNRGAIIENPEDDFIETNGCYLYSESDGYHLVLAPHEGIVSPSLWLSCMKKRKSKQFSQKSVEEDALSNQSFPLFHSMN